MEYLPCDQIARPTATVGQALRFREVCLLPAQLLCQQLLLGDVHSSADKSFENSFFNDGNRHGANVAHLTVGSNNSLDQVVATALLLHDSDGFGHGGSVLWMDEGQVLFDRRCSVLRV